MTEGNTIVYQDEAEGLINHKQSIAQRKQRVRFLVLTLIVAGTIGYLIFSGIRDTMGYYLTVSELITQNSQYSQEPVRASGKVSEGSVTWDPAEQLLRFTMTDDAADVPVVYKGVVPDSFKQGQKVVVEGFYADGVFTANELLTTCASKYE